MTNREITLVIKGFHDPRNGAMEPASLARLISRSKQLDRKLPASNDSLLFDLFGLDVEPGADAPVAAVTRLLDLGVVDKSWWLRADPVHLAPSRKGLLMVANQELELTITESEGLVQEIADAVLEEGWILKAPNPHRWYLKPAQTPELTTTPLDVVLGKNIDSYLPAGKDAKIWHTRLNEIQILLHTCQSNIERESNNKLPVNSVWFWGGGMLPQLKTSPWTMVWSDDVVSLALARLSDTEYKKTPKSFSYWLEQAGEGNHLLVMDKKKLLESPQEFESAWGEPLMTALRQSDIDRLTVYFGTNKCVTVTPGDLKPRWNWRFPFSRR